MLEAGTNGAKLGFVRTTASQFAGCRIRCLVIGVWRYGVRKARCVSIPRRRMYLYLTRAYIRLILHLTCLGQGQASGQIVTLLGHGRECLKTSWFTPQSLAY